MRRDIPRPPEAGVLNALRFGRDPLRYLEAVQARYADAVEVPVPGRPPLVVVTNPALVHEALGRPAAFPRVSQDGASVAMARNGIVQSEGKLWRQQRSIVTPALVGRQVRAYGNATGERGEALARELAAVADGGGKVDLHRRTTALTIRAASEVILGEDVGRERAGQFHESMRAAADELAISPSGLAPEWLPDRTSRTFREATRNVRELAAGIVERRRAALADGGDASALGAGGGAGDGDGTDGDRGRSDGADDRPADVLALLLAAEDDPDVTYPPGQIRDEVVNFLIAGHETTALALTYALSLLSWHPGARERVRTEAREVLGGERPRYEHVEELTDARRVFREAMRLYPPAWAIFREAAADVRLGDYRVADGSVLILPQYSIHRDERHFAAPDRFDPDRWERRDPDAVDAYFPFGSGPHACVGRQFALTGGPLTIARLVRDFDFGVPEHALDDLRPTITLRPRGGVSATVERAR